MKLIEIKIIPSIKITNIGIINICVKILHLYIKYIRIKYSKIIGNNYKNHKFYLRNLYPDRIFFQEVS